MITYIVTIQDHELPGEPTVALGVVSARHVADALDAADETLEVLARSGRGRCHASAHEVLAGVSGTPRNDEAARFVRVEAVVAPAHPSLGQWSGYLTQIARICDALSIGVESSNVEDELDRVLAEVVKRREAADSGDSGD